MRIDDYITDELCCFLTSDDVGEVEPHVTTFELKGEQVLCFMVNGHPLCYSLSEIMWYGLETICKRDNWRQY